MLDITSGQMDLDDCDIYFGIININAGFSGVCGIITRQKTYISLQTQQQQQQQRQQQQQLTVFIYYSDGGVARVY